ncbi:hypothetical protein FGG08_006132 [Glutinoglossum americanum]|uniref:ER membrane protein complex subunit 7 beta-sandwich domain-containing protein n=1 Tax=Glutinoglossum americanum TaxID=1670608 RepID=A0A9P8I1V3_9PEZI|nr:hypothetical protein FGG08_006132 [Glutinoglossum americanum]
MLLSTFTYTLLLLLLIPLASTASLTLFIPPTPLLPDPSHLPPSTHATLTTLNRTYTAPLQRPSRFTFRNLTAGSYLLDVHCRDYAFGALRVDVGADAGAVEVWQTFRGNEWGNRGERLGLGEGGVVEVRPAAAKAFFEERAGFSPLALLRSPMILLAVVSMGLMFGLPYMLDNMDPEMRAEFESNQKRVTSSSASPLQNFDLAGMLAGQGQGQDQQQAKGSGGGGGGGNGASGGGARRRAGN